MGDVDLQAAKALHDLHLLQKPANVEHHCVLCDMEDTPMGEPADEQARITAAVEAATAPLLARIADLEGAAASAEANQAVADAVAAAVAPLNTQIETLQSDLDSAVAAKVAAEKQLGDTVSFLEAEAATAAAEENRAGRVDAVRETGIFDEAHLEANADRWSSMEDAVWDTTLAEYKAIAERNGAKPPTPPATPPVPPARQPLTATADGDGTKQSAARLAIKSRKPRASTASVLA